MTATVVINCPPGARWEYLVRTVASARAQLPPPAEVIVVVDHDPALFARIGAELRGVTVLANGAGHGTVANRSTGIAHARTPLVALLDADAYAHPGWLAGLLAPFADPTVAGTGGLARPNWERPRPYWLPAALGEVSDLGIWSASLAVRREVFVAAGGFDALPGPDGRWVFAPGSVVDHPVPVERQRFWYLMSRCFAQGHTGRPSGATRGRGWAETATLLAAGLAAAAGRLAPTMGYRRPQWTKRYGTH